MHALRTIRSNQYRYIRCHERKKKLPCWHRFQSAFCGGDVYVPCMFAWEIQLVGSDDGRALITPIPIR